MRIVKLIALGLFLGAPAVALAQGTEEQRASCQPDAAKFCQQVGTDTQRVAQCLGQNYRRLSPGCRQIMRFGTLQNVCAAYMQSCGGGGAMQATVACLARAPGVSPACRNAVRAFSRR